MIEKVGLSLLFTELMLFLYIADRRTAKNFDVALKHDRAKATQGNVSRQAKPIHTSEGRSIHSCQYSGSKATIGDLSKSLICER